MRPKLFCNKDCDSMDGNRHKATAQRMPNSGRRRVRFGRTVSISKVIRCRAPGLTLESSVAEYGSALFRGKSDFAEYG